jgi:hypothetical protein
MAPEAEKRWAREGGLAVAEEGEDPHVRDVALGSLSSTACMCVNCKQCGNQHTRKTIKHKQFTLILLKRELSLFFTEGVSFFFERNRGSKLYVCRE